jgi:hypothetical protein
VTRTANRQADSRHERRRLVSAVAAPHAVRRVVAVTLVAVVVLVMTAPAVWAHAAFVSSRPEPGARLTTTPGVVDVAFSEPLIRTFRRWW